MSGWILCNRSTNPCRYCFPALKVNDDQHTLAPKPPPPPITRHGRWELRQLPDGTTEYAWIARQAGHYGPETRQPHRNTNPGRHRIPT